ncbi:MAG: phosphoribosyl-AMP cyclohydrolase [Candidatus Aureabacteria bacterium]|jgi:phosphoribosyl-AMP cyclohydrolase|nr:phosphoribosyl-AMP cyclohydrolase [Candidatus Auribacterota bacterium]
MKIVQELTFDERGLITAIIQDVRTNEVLMVAHMNRDALMKTVESGMTHFWSRSRKKLWLKGESSGHVQSVRGIFVDCDGDALLIKVDQKGGACHTGYRSCFYRKLAAGDAGFEIVGEKVFEPDKVYK